MDPHERAFDALIQSRIDEGLRQLDTDAPMPVPARAATIDIVVPVHEAYDVFMECLASLLAWTATQHRLILVDDASSDPRIWQAMQHAATVRSGTEIRRHEKNLGYLRTVNAVIAGSLRDVVLLNSDTRVGPDWVDRLAAAAHDGERAGLACPLSDNATLLSVIAAADVEAIDEMELQRRVVASARAMRPRLPVAVGFCMYVRRSVFDAIGYFDSAFDPGYGEESDFSMRALAAGFEIVAATDVLVRHRSGSSFGDGSEIQRRRLVHADLVRQRWPQHDDLIQAWWRDWPLREQAERLRRACSTGRPHVLQISHGVQRLGGIELHSRALTRSLAREMDVDLVAPEPSPDWADLRELDRGPGWSVRAVNRRLQFPNQTLFGVAADLGDPAMERQFLRILVGGGYRILHVHSLLRWNTLMPALLAKAVGVSVVVSLHDLSMLCPNYLMLPKDAEQSCGKARAGVDAGCVECLAPYRVVAAGVAAPDPQLHLDARWHVWKRTLEAADVIVAPSQYLVERIAAAFGSAVAARAVVVPHGLATAPLPRPRPLRKSLRAGFLFGETRSKGGARVLAMAEALADTAMCFVIHAVDDRSVLPRRLPANVEWSGSFLPEQVGDVLADLDLVLMPTIVGESFSLALSECQAAGVPVLASRDGAFVERIRDGIDGWLLSVDRLDDWIALLRRLVTDEGRAELARVAQACAALPVLDIDANADRYLALYRGLLAEDAHRFQLTGRVSATADMASLRLAEAIRRGALAIGDDVGDDALAIDGDPASRTSLQVTVQVQAHNRELLETTLESLQRLGPRCRAVVLDESGPPFSASSKSPDLDAWHLLIEAGDRVDPNTLRWLSRYAGTDTVAVCADFDHLSAAGHRYAAVAQLAWDRWRALDDVDPGLALFIRDDFWQGSGRWSRQLLAARYAMQLALTRASGAIAVPGRILVHRADRNRSPASRDLAWQAHVDVLRDHLRGEDWSIHATATLPGWTCGPLLSTTSRVVIVVWNERGVGADEVERLRGAIDWPSLTVVASSPMLTLPDCDVVGFWRSDVGGIDGPGVSRLLAWLQQSSVAAVAPRRFMPNGLSRPSGISVDQAWPSRIDGDVEWPTGASRLPAASSCCLLVRRQHLDSQSLATLAAPDSAASVAEQLRWQAGGSDIVLVGDVGVTQALVNGPIKALATETAAGALRQTWQALPMPRRQLLCRRPRARAGASLAGVPKSLPRIAALTRDDWASSQYRVHLPLRDLHEQGWIDVPVVWRLRTEPAPGLHQLEIEQPDILIAHHAFDDASLQLLEQVSLQLRIPIVLVVDDLIDAVPDYNPMRAQMPADIQRRLHRALALCSCLVVTSQALADAYSRRAWRCLVIENALPMAHWPLRSPAARSRRSRLRVGWAGAPQHAADLALIDELVRERDDVQWVFMGMAPPSASLVDAELHPMCAFDDYPQRLADLDLDIALVPLVDNAFNRGKSALKLIELGALGVAVIASDIAPYRDAPVLRVGPHLDEWRMALAALVSDSNLRERMAAELNAWSRSKHDLARRRDQWCDALSILRPDVLMAETRA